MRDAAENHREAAGRSPRGLAPAEVGGDPVGQPPGTLILRQVFTPLELEGNGAVGAPTVPTQPS